MTQKVMNVALAPKVMNVALTLKVLTAKEIASGQWFYHGQFNGKYVLRNMRTGQRRLV